jgi:hypothetical protein
MKVASEMPPLKHWLARDPSFSITRSEAVKWLTAQPEILQYVFNSMKNAGVIEFDLESRCWRGINWKPSVQHGEERPITRRL